MDGFRNEDDWPARYTIDFGKRLSQKRLLPKYHLRAIVPGEKQRSDSHRSSIRDPSEVREGSHEIFLP